MKTLKQIEDRIVSLSHREQDGLDVGNKISLLHICKGLIENNTQKDAEDCIDELAQERFITKNFGELQILLWVLEG